jgi:hypothetical protein
VLGRFSLRVAARHVWYGRFEEEGFQFRDTIRCISFPGMETRRKKSDLVGLLLATQARKRMRLSKYMSIQRSNSMVSADLDSASSSCATQKTSSMPNSNWLRALFALTTTGIGWRCAISWKFLGACLGVLLFVREEGPEHPRFRKEVALPLGSVGLALFVTLAVGFAGSAKCTRLRTRFTPSGQYVERATQLRSRFIVTLAAIVALTPHHVESSLALSILFKVILTTSTLSMAFLIPS